MRFRWLAAAAAAGLAGHAAAAPLTGTGGAENAIAGGTVIDFESTAPTTAASVTVDGVTFNALAGTNLTIGGAFVPGFNSRGRLALYNTRNPGSFIGLEIDFGGEVDAFAFNFGANDDSWLVSAFDSSNTLIETVAIPALGGSDAGNYFGISASGIARATVVQTGFVNDIPIDYVLFDNLTFREGETGVPAPGALALFGLGLLGLVAARRRA